MAVKFYMVIIFDLKGSIYIRWIYFSIIRMSIGLLIFNSACLIRCCRYCNSTKPVFELRMDGMRL